MADTTLETTYDGYVNRHQDVHGVEPTYEIVDNALIKIGFQNIDDVEDVWRGFADFALSLPTGATVTKVELIITSNSVAGTPTIDITKMRAVASSYAAANLFAEISFNVAYLTSQNLTTLQQYTLDLGSQAVTDLNAHNTWLSVGIKETNESSSGSIMNFKSLEDATAGNRPQLKVTYTVPSVGGSPTGGVAYSGGGGFIF